MPPTVKPRELSRVLTLLLALAPAGCGLAAYEKKMQETDARLARSDDENKLLGDPLGLPTGDAALAVDLFLRPPKGVAPNPIDPKDTPLRFPATAGACQELDLWVGAKDDDKDKLKKRIENRLRATPATWQPMNVQPPNGRPEIAFEWANLSAYRVYLHTTPSGVPVAVAFLVAQPSPPGADDAVAMSLETYAESADASKARGDYALRQNH